MQAPPVDAVVVGTGAAALVAALAAHASGAGVRVLEKTGRLGGTTALSGGLLWVPAHPRLPDDSEDEALLYLRRLAAGRVDEALIRSVVRTGPEVVRFLEAATGLRFDVLDKPDYHPELPGARAAGRCLAPNPFHVGRLGDWGEALREGDFPPLSWPEFDAVNAAFHPERLDRDHVARLAREGWVGMGRALVGHLLLALRERGVALERGRRATRLDVRGGAVVGVFATSASGEETLYPARRGVVLACGGFEWNAALVRRFVAGPMTHPCSAPASEGDGLVMATELGADLANMDDILRFPAAEVPGETRDGAPLYRMVVGERALPHAILVNRHGRRFVNEAHAYTDVGRVFASWDPVACEFPNQPCWAIFDQQYRDAYSVLGVRPGESTPEWLACASTPAELAERLPVPTAALTRTLERWNAGVAQLRDPDFARGESLFDRTYADAGRHPHPTLGDLTRPPFYALRVHSGCIGSSGGLRTDDHGRVLHVRGGPIPGLYAAGDSAASPTGPGYGGPGGPLGRGAALGYRVGRALAAEASRLA